MRTTLVLDDDLVQEAKHQAIDQKLTLSELVNRALRQALALTDEPGELPFAMVTFGPKDTTVHHEPADFSAQTDVEDRETLALR